MLDTLGEKLSSAFKNLSGKGAITEENTLEALKNVRMALLEADVHFKVVKEFTENVKQKSLGEKVLKGVNPEQQFIKIIQDELTQIMGGQHEPLEFKQDELKPVLIVGLNGAGKTTFSGKLAKFLKEKKNHEVYFIPADNFRPAAKDQLITHAKSLGIDYFDSDLSLTPKEIALAGISAAKKLNKKIILIDTAGRLQVDQELMGQLVDLKNAISHLNPETLLVADAMTGQEAVNVAKEFHDAVGLTGVVLSKMDSDARGGAALSIKFVTGVPIRYISVGEKLKDLEPFHPDRLAGRILDMGDVVTLVEKAQDAIDEKDAERMMKNLEKNKFTINDFINQMDTINKLGSMGSILKMIPGMGGMMKQVGDLGAAENEMKNMRVLINSMTKKEREDHTLLKKNESRILRIARGSGRAEKEVRDFIQKFEQMKEMMVGMMGMMKGGGLPSIPGMGPVKGFRTAPGQNNKKSKGKKTGRFGKKFF